ncbi:MAG TPA: UBP-type zinc finger domain-containing protein [Acidimicrobiia bacterium]|nr:UBP-type zinc finger domain-containing protein [Acidimicrobiia bacterium]
MNAPCEHFVGLVPAEPTATVCEQCVELGDRWVHLRACLTCGAVGCCDASKNRHARKHWENIGHPLIRSIEPGETWKFCFEDLVVER